MLVLDLATQPFRIRLIYSSNCPMDDTECSHAGMPLMLTLLSWTLFTRLTDVADRMPPVRWREHSFLDNPRCPEAVKRSKLTIYTSTVWDCRFSLCRVRSEQPLQLAPAPLYFPYCLPTLHEEIQGANGEVHCTGWRYRTAATR